MTTKRNLLDIPAYSQTLAARLTRLSLDRVRRWLYGYEYTYSVGEETRRKKKKPVVQQNGAFGSRYASFLDLIDLLFVKQFLDYGIPLQRLRLALAEAQRLVGGHHFAQRIFFTDGKNVYMEICEKGSDALIELLSDGQWVIAPIIKEIAHQIDFEKKSGLAEKWYPLGREGHVVLNPRVSYGAPTIVGRGVKTANVYDYFLAENQDIQSLCDWLSLSPEEARSAVEFEQQLAVA